MRPNHLTLAAAKVIKHRVRIDGDTGPWVVFSNSLGCTLEMWDAQTAALSTQYRVLRYDTRGHGGSEVTPGPYTLDMLARDLLDVLNAAEISSCTVVGLSLGGMIAQTAVLLAPHRFDRVVLADTTSHYGAASAKFWADRIDQALTVGLGSIAQTTPARWFTPAFAAGHPEVVERYQEMLLSANPAGYAGCCAAIAAIDATKRLAAVTVPVCVIVGEQDPSTTIAHAERIHKATAHSTLHVIPDAAHLSNVEQPERFSSILSDFLASMPANFPDNPGAGKPVDRRA